MIQFLQRKDRLWLKS